MENGGEDADRDDHDHAKEGGQRVPAGENPDDPVKRTAGQRGHTVDVLFEDVGDFADMMSRRIPPPIPVVMPRKRESTQLSGNCARETSAPTMEKAARPMASK